jgi:hypothetical protein
LEYQPDASPCIVRGDEQLLAVAVAGLVSGVHAIVERMHGARVTVKVSAGPDAGGARVEVSQAVVSLPPAWRTRFFDLAWPDRPGGVSMGACLAAARRVASLHGGDVELTAPERGGCAVTMRVG